MWARSRYLLAEVGRGLFRNFLMTFATVLVVTVTLTMVGAGLLVTRQVNLARDVLYADVEVSIFLADAITPAQQQDLETELRSSSVVAEVIYESKEQAYANAQAIFADDPVILENVRPEDLPASFRVRLTDPEEFEVIASLFSGRPGIDQIVDQRDILNNFFAIMGTIRWFTLGVAFFTLLAAVALIAVTIRLHAYARRRETSIMRLVGATDFYIRLPFVLEGVIATLAGAIGAVLILTVATVLVSGQLRENVQFLPFIDATDVLVITPLLVLGSAVVAAVVSLLATLFSARADIA